MRVWFYRGASGRDQVMQPPVEEAGRASRASAVVGVWAVLASAPPSVGPSGPGVCGSGSAFLCADSSEPFSSVMAGPGPEGSAGNLCSRSPPSASAANLVTQALRGRGHGGPTHILTLRGCWGLHRFIEKPVVYWRGKKQRVTAPNAGAVAGGKECQGQFLLSQHRLLRGGSAWRMGAWGSRRC